MQFHYQENPLGTQIILTKDDIDTLYSSIEQERDEENRFAVDFYGIPYEYEQSVDDEVRTMMVHLKGKVVVQSLKNMAHSFDKAYMMGIVFVKEGNVENALLNVIWESLR
ncbi:MAG: hypothetical protein EOP45_12310 [Sphingobacteriaceae bacterium]|nr:MAG: hypothetical protein EOP45_12310 [Sphingobacteriaceae bacterium]